MLLQYVSAFRSIFFDILESYEDSLEDNDNMRLSISQHGFFSENGLDGSRHHGSLSSQIANRASQWVNHLANAEDLSTGTSNASVRRLKMTTLERLQLVCKELEENKDLGDIVAKYFLDVHVENMNEVKKLPQMSVIIQFMVDSFLFAVKNASLVVIALDDVHFMDALSWKVLQSLFEQGENLMIVCTSRPFSSVKDPIDMTFYSSLQERMGTTHSANEKGALYWEFELQPFDEVEVRHLIASAYDIDDTDVDESLLTFIYEQSGGMPHFAQEILIVVQQKMQSNSSLGTSKLNKDQVSQR